ncbi:MAG: restriction endonuclease subunit S [Pirellulaceae bacterium]
MIGKTTVIPIDDPLAYSNHMTRIRLEQGMNPSFVAKQLHFLWMSGYFRHRCNNHVNQASIAAEPLSRTVPLVVAPSQQQDRIADTLDELLSDLDAGVAALERVRAKLGQYRAAVLKAAVEGELTAEWRGKHPATEPASDLLKRILAERRRRWEGAQLQKFKNAGKVPPKDWKTKYPEPVAPATTHLLPLPTGWCWATLDQVFQVERGKFTVRPRNDPRYYGGDEPFVQIGDLPREGGIIQAYRQTLNQAGLSISKKFPAGTVLIAIVGATIGNTGILGFDSCCPDSLVALRSSSPTLLRLADAFLRVRKLLLRASASASGGQPNINLDVLQRLTFPLPPIVESEAIVEDLDDQLSVIDHLESYLDSRLQSSMGLRQSILRHAFTGQLVPQDPADEPASELLKRIADEREKRERQAQADKNGKPRTKTPRKKRTAKSRK